jgi:hypothetical protein
MKTDTPAPVLDTVATYSMLPQTTGMCTAGMYAPGPQATALHPMQNMYNGMQLQQQLHQQQQQLVQQPVMPMGSDIGNPYGMPGASGVSMPGATTQNVSVIDFKPNVVADHYAQQLQHQHQLNTAAYTASAVPSMGLIGHDGQYQPAVNAGAYNTTPGLSEYSPYPTGVGTSYNDHLYHAYRNTPHASSVDSMQNFGQPLRARPPRPMYPDTGSRLSFDPAREERQRHLVGAAVRDVLNSRPRPTTTSDASRQLARSRLSAERYYE